MNRYPKTHFKNEQARQHRQADAEAGEVRGEGGQDPEQAAQGPPQAHRGERQDDREQAEQGHAAGDKVGDRDRETGEGEKNLSVLD